jgi:hypothetical protein
MLGALHIVNSKFLTVVLPKVEFGKIPIKMLLIDVLIYANKTALQNRKKTFQRIRVSLSASPFELRVIDSLVKRDRRVFVMLGLIRHEMAVFVDKSPDVADHPAMIEHSGADFASALNKAHDHGVMGLTSEAFRSLGLSGPRQFGFVCFHDLTKPTKRAWIAGSHGKADAVPKMPSRFHAAAKEAL